MKIYFDESGNTGCVIPNKNGVFYNDEQRHFVLAGVVCKNKEDEQVLANRYLDFKKRYNIQGEIKGSDMMKRDNNTMLVDFIDNLIDDSHFYVCCYDKIFYLASIITQYFFTRQLMEDDPLFYFTMVSALTQEDISVFLKYCECNTIGTDQASLDFCKFVVDFDFKKIDPLLNGYVEMAKLVLKHGEAIDFPLPFGCYINDDYTHVINMTALGESLLAIKEIYNINTKEMQVVHDHILEFENEFFDSFGVSKVPLEFMDSKDEILLQYADNIASIFRKCCTETIKLFRSNQQWDVDKQWFPSIYSKVLKKLSYARIKWDTAISDQILPLCVEKMFDDSFPVAARNDAVFYSHFVEYKKIILTNILSQNYSADL